MPICLNVLRSMFSLWPDEAFQASKTSCAVSRDVPAAMFSPEPGTVASQSLMRVLEPRPRESVWEK
jgi:hypothetical protein